MFSSSFQSLWKKLVKPEKSQTYLVHSRINCSSVSTSLLFEETKLSTKRSLLPYSVHPDKSDNKTRLNFPYTAKPPKVSKPRNCLREPTSVSIIFRRLFSLVKENPRGRQIAWNDADILLSLQLKIFLSLAKFLMVLTYFWQLYVNFLLAF